MEPHTVLPFPNASPDSIEHDLAEVDAAIALVARGVATRVHVVGLMRSDEIAWMGLAHAQQANVGFSFRRDPDGGSTITLGPRKPG